MRNRLPKTKKLYGNHAKENDFIFDGLTRRGHVRYLHKDGKAVIILGPSLNDPRTLKNQIALFRRLGRQTK